MDPEGRGASAADRLLLGALAWAGGRGPDLAPAAREVRRWARLLRSAERRGFVETLAHALAVSGAEPALPAPVRAALRAALELGTARNVVLLSEAARLQDTLAARGVPSVALKGAALLAAHYPHPGARHAADLDLLVPAERLADAAAALAGEGPAMAPMLDHRGGVVHVPAHAAPFDTAGGVSCDLHFQLPGFHAPDAAARVLATARAVPLAGGRALRIPGPVDCAAIACVHVFAGHADATARYLPRLVADLEALDGTAGLDWEAVRRAAGPDGAPSVERGRALLESARRGDAAAVFPGRLAILARELRPLAAQVLADARALFPTRRFMARRYGVPERSPRLLLYYLARPGLAVRDRLRR